MKIYSDLNQVKVPETAQSLRQGVGPAERAQQYGVRWNEVKPNEGPGYTRGEALDSLNALSGADLIPEKRVV